MARQRRGGFRPEIRGTLGTLLRTTLAQASVVRDALERGAREGRSRLDEARANRRRHDTLAELGEIVLELIRRGEIDLDELPEARGLIRELDELDEHDDRGREPDDPDEDVPRAPTRRRFDDRKPTRDLKAPRREPPKVTRDLKAPHREDRDDGTVSSQRWKPPSRGGKPTKVWRPVVEDAPVPDSPRKPETRERTKDLAPKRGGISFEDEDLADYMHPDDVPPKPSSEGDS
jgi:hypothetical protein